MNTLLLSDDFGESNYMQALLSKLGISVQVSANPSVIASTIANMNPDLIMVSTSSRKFDGVATSLDLKKKYTRTKVVLLKTGSVDVSGAMTALDGVLDTPVGGAKLVELLTTQFNMEAEELNKKLKLSADAKKKMHESAERDNAKKMVSGAGAGDDDKIRVSGGVVSMAPSKNGADKFDPGERTVKYQKAAKEFEPIDTKQSLDSQRIRDFNKEIRSKSDPKEFEDLDQEKRAFAKALFTED